MEGITVYVGVAVGIALVIGILAQFFIGPGGLLAIGNSINVPAPLEALKKAILKRYLDDEAAFARGEISKLAWEGRRSLLVGKYIDAARRLDFLQHLQAAQAAAAASAGAPAPQGAETRA